MTLILSFATGFLLVLSIYFYTRFRIERNKAISFRYNFISMSYKRDALFKQLEKERQAKHYYKSARFGEAYGCTGNLSDLCRVYDESNAEAATKSWAQSKQADIVKAMFNKFKAADRVHDEIVVIGDYDKESIKAIKKELDVQRATWASNREPILQNLPKRKPYERGPEYTATPSEFHVLKMKLLKRMIDLNLINDNQEGEASFRMPYGKEKISLVIKDDPSGNVTVFADGEPLKPSESDIIISFLEKTRNHDFTK